MVHATPPNAYTPEVSDPSNAVTGALEAARELARAGVPVFLAPPRIGPDGLQDWTHSGGYQLPRGWEHTAPDPSVLDAWRPGMAVCAVMGRGLDGIDTDAHKGGYESLDILRELGAVPPSVAVAETPSGGTHDLVASVGVRSRDALLPGVDLKAGIDGVGHGFLFLAPTVKLSKSTGQLGTYRWRVAPEATRIAAAVADDATARLRMTVEAMRAPVAAAVTADDADPERVRAYCSSVVASIARDLAEAATWPDGKTDSRGRGWEKMVADAAWRIASVGVTPHSGMNLAEAEGAYLAALPEVMIYTDGYDAHDKWAAQARRAEPITLPADGQTRMGLTGSPLVASVPVAEAVRSVEAVQGPPPVPDMPAVFDPPVTSERGVALAAMSQVGHVHRWCRDEVGWYTRSAARGLWVRQAATAGQHARAILHELSEVAPSGDSTAPDGSDQKARYERARMLGVSARRAAVAALMVDAAPASGFDADALDADPRVLWAGGWCWDLARSAEAPHLADVDLLTPHTRSAAVMPAQVPTPRWDALIESMFPHPEARAYVGGVLGAATTGMGARILGVVYGPTGMGKTTLLELASRVLGSYASQLDPDLLDARRSTEFKVMDLRGVRLGWVDEGPTDNRQGQERLKALTGGATLRGAHKGKPSVTFRATHTLFFTDNREPDVADPAILDRVRGLHITGSMHSVARAVAAIKADEDAWLKVEGPGVLAWLMANAARFLADRSTADMPEADREALERLSREQSPVLSWLDECVEPGRQRSGELYASFRAHAESMGMSRTLIPSITAWGRALSDAGHPGFKSNGQKFRPLQVRTTHPGPGWVGPQLSPEALVLPSATVPELSPTVPNCPTVPENLAVSRQGSASRNPTAAPTVPETATVPVTVPDETPSQVAVGDSGDSWDSFVEDQSNKYKEEYRGNTHARPSPPSPDPATDPLAATRVGTLPAVKVRGSEPRACTMDDAAELLATLAGARVTMDCETTGYPVGHEHYALRTIQQGTASWCVVLDAADDEAVTLACATLDAAAEIVAHSATADVSLVALRAGRDPAPWWHRTTDTAILAALAPPEVSGLHEGVKPDLSLERLSARLLPEPFKPSTAKARMALFRAHKWLTNTTPDTPLERSGWACVDHTDPVMLDYDASDVLDTADLRDRLPEPSADVLARERFVQRVTARLPERGLLLDPARVTELATREQAQADRLADELTATAGVNPSSTAEVGAALQALGAELPRTRTGKASTAASAVELIAGQASAAGDLARRVLDWREHDKLLSTYLRPALIAAAGDGRAYPTILTLGAAATGRMSSVRPNIQNVVRPTEAEAAPGGGGGMRGMYLADPGHTFISADFSSVEVRIAAAVTGDVTLAHMVREGTDLHGEVVKLAWGLHPGQDGFKSARYAAKRAVFGYLYGAGLTTMAKQLGEHGAKAAAVVDALRALTPQLITWDRELRRAVEQGAAKSWTHPGGRVAWFNAAAPHKSLNTVVQGWGRELLVDAMLRWELRHPGHVVVPIHDELVVMVPTEHAAEWTTHLVEAMTASIGEGETRVPIVAEAAPPSRRWGTVEP